MGTFEDEARRKERERLRELEEKDLEVERNRGPRPLEGFAHGHTTWTAEQDDAAAASVHAGDADKAERASEEQVERLEAGWDGEPSAPRE